MFGYGFLRFLLELWRDDVERGSYGPTLDKHVYIPLCLLLMALGFVFGISLGIANKRARTVARVLALRAAGRGVHRAQAGELRADRCRTSSRRASSSASAARLAVSFFYARFWEEARKNPSLAMSLGDAAASAS